MTAFCEIHSMVIIDDESPCPYCREEVRERCRESLTRALTAQAWAVAIALLTSPADRQLEPVVLEHADGWRRGVYLACNDVADLPAPADLAAEILG